MPGTRLFSRTNYQVRRGFSELLTEHSLSDEEWRKIRVIFDERCAFCGIEDSGNPRTGLIPDHLICAKNLGAFCIGNVVPACQDCNDRRGKMDWKEYLLRFHRAYAVTRIARIEAYLRTYPYNSSADPYARLTEGEKAQYVSLLEDWDKLWKRAQMLRDQIHSQLAHKRKPTAANAGSE
jgi:hypothetical protein